MENIPPSSRNPLYYSKAVSSLCQSASRFHQAVKRRTILEMINQERERRQHIEQLRQDRMNQISRSKSSSKLDRLHTQSDARRQLDILRDRNTLMRKMCHRSIDQAKKMDHEYKRQSAQNIKMMIENSHRAKQLRQSRQMKRSFIRVKQLYERGKQATITRNRKNLSQRFEVLQRNNSEVQTMLRQVRHYDFMANSLTCDLSSSRLQC